METISSDLNNKERKKLFFIELVRAGISFDDAYVVSEIVASAKPPEDLTLQERWLVKEVCQKWLDERNRENFLQHRLEQLGTAYGSATSIQEPEKKTDLFDGIKANQTTPQPPSGKPHSREENTATRQPTVLAIARKLAALSHSSEKIRDVLILNGLNSSKWQYAQPSTHTTAE
ncbi:hypothetical protein H6G89_13645 [Oscillatoria sp. FACHB-1407]|uniref:hypothetical protein n=1 Tax=Oscillatoria sp. FACHB-1407 TaxID=2692847 RepID=UPI001687AC57|nr:hypothetical protein [Oscillatoria sp. FACHB-1407]MBD2462092.1 hypothetical protein [Oscillatoria sp. FACHB-1407]